MKYEVVGFDFAGRVVGRLRDYRGEIEIWYSKSAATCKANQQNRIKSATDTLRYAAREAC